MTEQEGSDEASAESQLLEIIGRWRARRARLIERGSGPVSISSEVTVLFHVIPALAFVRRPITESWQIPEQKKGQIYVPHTATRQQYNFDGFIRIAWLDNPGTAFGYTQIFRSGIIEYANSNCYSPVNVDGVKMILGQTTEQELVRCYENALVRLSETSETLPIYLGCSLIGIAGKQIHSTFRQLYFQNALIPPRQSIVSSPEFSIRADLEEDPPYPRTLLPLVNHMWQAFGYDRTSFMTNGEWNPFGSYR
ncbi:MAG TPA: hypothetical protein VGM02_06055 [Acidobacteriaceae bacterium]|jgi:hypothetical protein